jgi:uncharacterized membrane protein YuzA (DUF378 family)/ribosomal protein S27E
MFCPNCGTAEQTPETYCRNCGGYLRDPAGGSSLVSRIFGAGKPETHININFVVNLVTMISSLLLVAFLNGYFDAQRDRTGAPTPPIAYILYGFLGLLALWQALSLFSAINLKRKFSGRTSRELPAGADASADTLSSPTTRELLSPFEPANTIPTSVLEDTTRDLDKVPRK